MNKPLSDQDDLHPAPGVEDRCAESLGNPAPPARQRRSRVAVHLAHIDADLCTGCEVCNYFCPNECIEFLPGPCYERIGARCWIDPTRCVGCLICAEFCRWQAIGPVPRPFSLAPRDDRT